jgi:hypothetical protein
MDDAARLGPTASSDDRQAALTCAAHHAVDSGSFDTVKALVEAGARLDTTDLSYQATPLGWAEYLQRPEIAAYLREQEGHG